MIHEGTDLYIPVCCDQRYFKALHTEELRKKDCAVIFPNCDYPLHEMLSRVLTWVMKCDVVLALPYLSPQVMKTLTKWLGQRCYDDVTKTNVPWINSLTLIVPSTYYDEMFVKLFHETPRVKVIYQDWLQEFCYFKTNNSCYYYLGHITQEPVVSESKPNVVSVFKSGIDNDFTHYVNCDELLYGNSMTVRFIRGQLLKRLDRDGYAIVFSQHKYMLGLMVVNMCKALGGCKLTICASLFPQAVSETISELMVGKNPLISHLELLLSCDSNYWLIADWNTKEIKNITIKHTKVQTPIMIFSNDNKEIAMVGPKWHNDPFSKPLAVSVYTREDIIKELKLVLRLNSKEHG